MKRRQLPTPVDGGGFCGLLNSCLARLGLKRLRVGGLPEVTAELSPCSPCIIPLYRKNEQNTKPWVVLLAASVATHAVSQIRGPSKINAVKIFIFTHLFR